jgi:two-component system, NtrC family, response regulator AtoC
MRSLERVIADIAPTDIPVLLSGESGTGKEVVALELHQRSQRPQDPFFKCSCGSVSAEQLSTHLSPLKEGDKVSRGTIFLDEINQLSSSNQSCLLQLLPDCDGRFQRSVRMRLISATTRNLEEEMREGRFRQELYYRINGVCLRLPALRDRKEDIPVLLGLFLKKYASLFGLPEPHLGPATMDLLLRHAWPGNVRELENFARKIVALRDERLALGDMASAQATAVSEPAASAPALPLRGKVQPLKEASREASRKAERELILQALERTHWNRKRTARELQISYKALLYKLKQLGLDGTGDFRDPLADNTDSKAATP